VQRRLTFAVLTAAVAACSLFTDLNGLAGGDGAGDATATAETGGADDAADGSAVETSGFVPCEPPCLPPSCANGAAGAGTDCNGAFCCTSLEVPGGTFDRIDDAGAEATVSAFFLDKFEVTVGRFRAFVDAGLGTQAMVPPADAGAHPRIPGSGWNPNWNARLPTTGAALRAMLACGTGATWRDTPTGEERLPMACTTWALAFAFCAWDGGRLPTEAEWNFAAAGGSIERYYPWSDPPSSTTYDPTYAVYNCTADGSDAGDCSAADLPPVGSRPKGDGLWGHSDLSGSMIERLLDYDGAYQVPCIDCANLVPAVQTAERGSCWKCSFLPNLTTRNRDGDPPDLASDEIGFRCAR